MFFHLLIHSGCTLRLILFSFPFLFKLSKFSVNLGDGCALLLLFWPLTDRLIVVGWFLVGLIENGFDFFVRMMTNFDGRLLVS